MKLREARPEAFVQSVAMVVEPFRVSNYELRQLVRAIVRSPAFYSSY